METRSGPTKSYWGLLVLAVILSSVVTYSAVSLTGSRSSTSNSQQTQRLIELVQSENSLLQSQATSGQPSSNATAGLDAVKIYAETSVSVVTVQGVQVATSGNASVLGSGFVAKLLSSYYIVTNFHVVQNVTDVTVTFSDGNSYPAVTVGTDPYSDLAVLNTSAPQQEFHPLRIVGSASLEVGEPVVAIGNPFGLSGSMTVGIISQLGRTIAESLAGNFAIANVIQFSAPINPGNSGGPLIDRATGKVIGIVVEKWGLYSPQIGRAHV
jgi:S1-C subfamily serine protease